MARKSSRQPCYSLVAVPTHSQTELWNWSLAVGEEYCADADPIGWRELIYVLEGELSLEFEMKLV